MTEWIAWAREHWLWLTPLYLIAFALPALALRFMRKDRSGDDFGADRWATKADIKKTGLFR